MLTPRKRPARVIVKLGTGVLTSGVGRLDTARIASHVRADRRPAGVAGTEVLVVSSGAVGLGMGRLGLARRPPQTARKQACAAVGQSLLMETWQAGFAPHGITVAQVLLTHEDLRARARYLGVKETLAQVIGYGAVPSSTRTTPSARPRSTSPAADSGTTTRSRRWSPAWSAPSSSSSSPRRRGSST
jgi:glutamate 5-kinase